MRIHELGLAACAFALVAATPAFAEKVKKEAIIVTIQGESINARSREGPLHVTFDSSTEIKQSTGVVQRKTVPAKDLIPGLIITIEGDLNGENLAAKEIRFKESDWRAAMASKAGTSQQFAEMDKKFEDLQQQIIDGQEYVVRDEVTVYFATGSVAVAEQYKQDLRTMAAKAPSYGNYRVSIMGFADQHGNAEANEKLSMRRANAVSNFVRQTSPIQPGRVLAPSAMGEGTTAPGESPPTNDDEARRVLVRIVTPKSSVKTQ
jgi:outer membrane protein OmpA-like peptidoglycan-associated protein